MQIIYSSKFLKEYKSLPSQIKNKAEKQEVVFRQNPHDLRLKTHRLTGKLKDFWSFSINHQYRIIFQFDSEDIIWFHSVGTHAIYK